MSLFTLWLLGPFAAIIPPLFWSALFIFSCALYLFNPRSPRTKLFWRLALGAVIFRVLFAAFLTFGQYYLWNQSEFTRLFLEVTAPTGGNYFFEYTWFRFWLNVGLSLGGGALFFWFLRLLRRFRERFFEEGEVELGLLLSILVGWPYFPLFLVGTFLMVIALSLARIPFGQRYTTLGWPMLVATGLILLWGPALLEFFGLSAFKV